jgi:hypothetical protein
MKTEIMDDNSNVFEPLLEKATEYGKTSYELIKLKAVERTSDVVSAFIPHTIVFVLVITFLLFLNVGVAIWLGDLLGKLYYGFFAVSAFYILIGIVIHFFLYKWLKRLISDYIVKQVFK